MNSLHLSSLLNEGLIKINVLNDSVESICDLLVEEFYDSFTLPEPKHVIMHKIMERERQESTVFSTGFALPHIHLDNFDDTIIGVAIPAVPIESENGQIKIVFLIVSGKVQNSLYLHILQSIIKISKDEKLFDKLIKVKKTHDFIKYVTEGDFSVKKELSVGDLMNKHVSYINKNSSLRELGNLFYEKNNGYCPVVDNKDNLIGEVTLLEYMMTGFPEYTKYLESMNFLNSFEPFEKLSKEESSIKVADIVKKIECTLSPDDAVIEAVFLMKKFKRRDIPVVVKNKIVGIISFMDIFRKVIKG